MLSYMIDYSLTHSEFQCGLIFRYSAVFSVFIEIRFKQYI